MSGLPGLIRAPGRIGGWRVLPGAVQLDSQRLPLRGGLPWPASDRQGTLVKRPLPGVSRQSSVGDMQVPVSDIPLQVSDIPLQVSGIHLQVSDIPLQVSDIHLQVRDLQGNNSNIPLKC